MKKIINENQRGILFKNGKFVKLLNSGKYHIFGGCFIEILDIRNGVYPKMCSIDILLKDKNFLKQTKVIEVLDEQIALHFINGKFKQVLETGRYIFWAINEKHNFSIINISKMDICNNIPEYILNKIDSKYYHKIEVLENQIVAIYFDKKFKKVLNSGIYYFWKCNINLDYVVFDISSLNTNIYSLYDYITIDNLLSFEQFSKNVEFIEVLDEQIALHFVDEKFEQILETGKYAFFNTNYSHRFDVVDISDPEVAHDIPKYIFDKMDKKFFVKIEASENELVVVYYDNIIKKFISKEKCYFWKNIVDIKEIRFDINNSELNLYDIYTDITINNLIKYEDFSDITVGIDIPEHHIGLHFLDNSFKQVLETGKYLFFNVNSNHRFDIVDISNPEVSDDIPKYIFDCMDSKYFMEINVLAHEKTILYYNNVIVKLLEAGDYYFWKGNILVDFVSVDTRLTQLNVTGQEILTQDKVTLRINFVCTYKITDYIKIFTDVDEYRQHIYTVVQLALRECIGKYKIDEVLCNKDEISKIVFENVKKKCIEFYIDIFEANIKDIIIPGEIRDIMNTVLIAEKKAQANVISRREEVASTRSLLNTAKLMDENKTLLKLKELEYIERICENVGNININGGGDIISQISQILKSQ